MIFNKDKSHPHHRNILALEIVLGLLFLALIALATFYFATNKKDKAWALELRDRMDILLAEENFDTVRSSLGFSVTYDNTTFSHPVGFEIDVDGNIISYEKKEVLETKNLAILELAVTNLSPLAQDSILFPMMTIVTNTRDDFFGFARAKYGEEKSNRELLEAHFSPKPEGTFRFDVTEREEVTIGGTQYYKVVYEERYQGDSNLSSVSTTYYQTEQFGRPYSIEFRNYHIDPTSLSKLEEALSNITYFSADEDAPLRKDEVSTTTSMQMPLVRTANAAVSPAVPEETLRVVSKNAPAVVRVYNLGCMDIYLQLPRLGTSPTIPVCAGGLGSGAIISSDGYLFTNGHVIEFSTRDAIIQEIQRGNPEVITLFIGANLLLGGYSQSQALQVIDLALAGNRDALAYAIKIVRSIPDDYLRVSNEKQSVSIQLGDKPAVVDINALYAGDIEKVFTGDGIVKAKLVAVDYNPDDLRSTEGFTASDVAILKMEGDNYPFVELGSIDGLVTGSDITVIGFPGVADNELVDSNESKPTATKGVVSAIRNASGNTGGKLIQSDVAINHGNSGGPVFDASGKVVGVATYGISEAQGYNYMRDIKDVVSLLSSNNIVLSKESSTQSLWVDGLADFVKAYYSDAVESFTQVVSVYPDHRLAGEYIDISQVKIANGEEATKPIVYVIIGGSIFGFIVLLVVVIFILKKRSGKEQPQTPNMPRSATDIQPPVPQPVTQYPTVASTPPPIPTPQPQVVPQVSPITPTIAPAYNPAVTQPAQQETTQQFSQNNQAVQTPVPTPSVQPSTIDDLPKQDFPQRGSFRINP